jgi:hypothetical protein
MTSLLCDPAGVELSAYLDALDGVDLVELRAAAASATPAAEGVALDVWFILEANWWRARRVGPDEGYMVLVACELETLARSARFHGARSVAELVERSPKYRRFNAAHVKTPARRPLSLLASALDSAVEDYLQEGGAAALLAAWSILGVAEEADFYHADTVEDFTLAQAACDLDELEEAAAVAF